ncbi:MAG: hypothetical protein Q8922_06220 [Bacteroidota bacterium]|nr:hypothetical protein [Bacteroidota bacterium]MDP4233753.1 hypothetical protein [Bacteroidota bacterium]MDP4242392.1 hypothetical protein [Bacteroidota bacterium]MDP4287514.1 hypothetical protein [Bacteroidota bacterium]
MTHRRPAAKALPAFNAVLFVKSARRNELPLRIFPVKYRIDLKPFVRIMAVKVMFQVIYTAVTTISAPVQPSNPQQDSVSLHPWLITKMFRRSVEQGAMAMHCASLKQQHPP